MAGEWSSATPSLTENFFWMDNPFADFVARYRDDPARFVREMLSIEPQPWQAEVMAEVAKGTRRISIRSAHGVGKSATLAWLSIWFALTRYPSKTVMTAPSSTQLFDALFAEVRGQCANLPEFLKGLLVVTSDRIALKGAPDEVFITARTSRAETPEAMQGIHSANVLLLADEASGIPEEVFNAASGSMSGHNATTILTGNPTRTSGYFYDTHTRLDGWRRFHISAFDSTLVSPEFVREVVDRSGAESNEYRIRVLGEFPSTDDDTIIPLELAQSATTRDVVGNPKAQIVWGLDVARYGGDRSALARRQGNVVERVQTWRNLDLMQLCTAVKAEYDIAEPRPAVIAVDAIGMGAGVVDRLQQLGLPVLGVNVSEAPSLGNYRNLRAELWYRLRDWLYKRDCKLPKDDALVAELSAVRYVIPDKGRGKVQIEGKDDMKRRGLRSPDLADALVLTFAAPEALYVNGGMQWNWQNPPKRGLRGIV